METQFFTISSLWHGLGWPLIRLMASVSAGLLFANFIEALNWTRGLALLAKPLIRMGNLSETAGASFAMAFFSGVGSNTLLAEAYDQGRMTRQELVLANLFNSLPNYFIHLPTVFFLTAPLIKMAAFLYVGLTLLAAVLRTALVLVAGRFLLPSRDGGDVDAVLTAHRPLTMRQALEKAWQRFRKRIRKIILFTVPIYTLIYFMQKLGGFRWLEHVLTEHLTLLSWLDPRAFGIVIAHVAAEFAAGLAAAGALLEAGTLDARQVVLALLVGNVLASPVRTFRHQYPYYAGIFNPRLAAELVFCSQAFRVGSIIAVGIAYYWLTA
ncbi:MAG TPA: hypothetical protein VLL73_08595 [Desulfurivibrionaceae bacterium]|nr:hypothetical protein [Desulfurivibrionaceae bacterium]